jgi:hypothetical protein
MNWCSKTENKPNEEECQKTELSKPLTIEKRL